MESIKKIISPGKARDDEVMYSNQDPQNDVFKGNQGQTQLSDTSQSSGAKTGDIANPEKKEHGIARQILNPGGDKYDEVAYGSPASQQAQKDTAGHRRFDSLTETAQGQEPRTAASNLRQENVDSDDASTTALRRGIPGPFSESRGASVADPSTSEGNLGEKTKTDAGTGFSRDATAALGLGGAAAGAGTLASERSGSNQKDLRGETLGETNPSTTQATTMSNTDGSGRANVDSSTYTDRKFPLAGNSSSTTGNIGGTSGYGDRSATSTLGSGDPHVPGEFPNEEGVDRHHHSGLGSGTATGLGAAGAGAGGLGAYEATRDTKPTSTTSGANASSLQSGSSDYPTTGSTGATIGGVSSTSTGTERDHHYGRDAAVLGAGAGGLGAYEATRDTKPTSATSGTNTSSLQTGGSNYPTTGSTETSGGAYSTSTGTEKDHHYGRDAAALGGAGTAGAAGYGAYEASKDRGPTSTSSYQQPSTATTSRSAAEPSTTSGYGTEIGTGSKGEIYIPQPTAKPGDQHHYGRDAALAGGAGALGYGAYKGTKDHDASKTGHQEPSTSSTSRSVEQPGYGTSTGTGTGTSSGLTGTDLGSQSTTTPTRSEKDHHYGRDAALAGGAGATGAAGYGAYESLKDREPISSTYQQPSTQQHYGTSTGTTSSIPQSTSTSSKPEKEHHYGRDAALAGGAVTTGAAGYGAYDSVKDKDQTSKTTPQSKTTSGTSSYPSQDPSRKDDHHYGRDAAAAGGAGLAGAGAYTAYENTKNRGDTGPASKTIGPHSSNVANVADPRVKPEPEKMKDSTTAGPHKSDLLNKADPRVESDPQKAAEKDQKDHHYVRDAALAGGAGAAGYGAYKAHEGREDTSAATQPEQREHHLGRDAAAIGGAGATDTAGYEAYKGHEHKTHHGSSDLGSREDVKRQGQSSTQDDHHYGRDAAALGTTGAAGYGAHKIHEGRDDLGTREDVDTRKTQPEKREHHHGRDAAALGGAGAAGAAGYGAYKAHEGREDTKATDDISRQAQPERHEHHHGRDEAALGGAGATGLAGYEASKVHHGRSDLGTVEDVDTRQTQPEKREHHHGRDAAALGGAGATGAAGYEAYKAHEKHDDAKAKEDLSQKAQSGKHDDHHYGRDAAAVGGTGAAAYGAEKVVDDKHERKLQKAREEEAAKRSGEPVEKKPSLIHRILHPGESKEAERKASEGEYAAAGAAGAAGAGTYGAEKHHHNKLHKDPPAEYTQGHRHGDQTSGLSSSDNNIVTEPHTGLPMDISKYGTTGQGGTDGATQIEGYTHSHSGAAEGTATDWEQIRKANTPY